MPLESEFMMEDKVDEQPENDDIINQMDGIYNQYIRQGLVRCVCKACENMIYPVLVRQDSNPQELFEEH